MTWKAVDAPIRNPTISIVHITVLSLISLQLWLNTALGMDNNEQTRTPDRRTLLVMTHAFLAGVDSSVRRAGSASAPQQHTESAERIVSFFTRFPQIHATLPFAERVRSTQTLQSIAFADHTSAPSPQISDFCAAEWARLLEINNDNLATLVGMAQFWWFSAAPILERINDAISGSSSSPDSAQGHSMRSSGHGHARTSSNNNTTIYSDGDARIYNSPDAVEARAFLQTANEFFDRAIEAASTEFPLWEDVWNDVSDYQTTQPTITIQA